MSKFLVLLTDLYGRPTFGLVDDPCAYLAWRVAQGLMTAKEAAATPVYTTDAHVLDRAKLDEAIAWERLIERARADPAYVIELFNKKKLTPEGLERLREVLTYRAMSSDEDWTAPWPWNKDHQ